MSTFSGELHPLTGGNNRSIKKISLLFILLLPILVSTTGFPYFFVIFFIIYFLLSSYLFHITHSSFYLLYGVCCLLVGISTANIPGFQFSKITFFFIGSILSYDIIVCFFYLEIARRIQLASNSSSLGVEISKAHKFIRKFGENSIFFATKNDFSSNHNQRNLTVLSPFSLAFFEKKERSRVGQIEEANNTLAQVENQSREKSRIIHDIKSPLVRIRNIALASNTPEIEIAINEIDNIAYVDNSLDAPFILDILLKSIVKNKIYEFQNNEIKYLSKYSYALCTISSQRLTSILSNLINNSIESRSDKQITVLVRSEVKDGKAQVYVSDNGSGILSEHDIFKRGYTTKERGRGIGLSSAKEYLNQKNCDISFISSSSGTTFKIEIPARVLDIKSTLRLQAVLIDDDKYIQQEWKGHFAKNEESVLCFDSINSFLEHDHLEYNLLIFLDRYLREERGDIDGVRIYNRGYKNIFLTSAEQSNQTPFWIISSVSKSASAAYTIFDEIKNCCKSDG